MEVIFDRSLLPIDDIAISDSSQRLLTLGTSTLVRLQDANTNEIVRTFTGLDSVRLPTLNSNGQLLAGLTYQPAQRATFAQSTVSQAIAQRIHQENNQEIDQPQENNQSRDDDALGQWQVKVWNAQTGDWQATLLGLAEGVDEIAFGLGDELAIASANSIQLWNANTAERVWKITRPALLKDYLPFSEKASPSVKRRAAAQAGTRQLLFHEEGSQLTVKTFAGSLYELDAATGALTNYQQRDDFGYAVDRSSGVRGATKLTIERSKVLNIWNKVQGEFVLAHTLPIGHGGLPRLLLSPEGDRFVVS